MNLFRPHCSLQKKKEKYPLDFIVGHVSMNKITGGFRCGGFGGGGGF